MGRRSRSSAPVFVAAVGLALAACLPASEPVPSPATHPTVTIAPRHSAPLRAAWTARGLGDYRLRYRVENLNGMGGGPKDGIYDATVHDGTVTECTITDSPVFDDGSSCLGSGQGTVEALFRWVDLFDPDHTDLRLDPEWGFPTFIHFDVPDLADEEMIIDVLDFQPLGDPASP